MLSALRIQNVVLIDRLDIDFQAGLCALTGETGAGKSILLDALGLALGARSEAGLVRKGAEQAQVSAEFHLKKSHPAFKILQDAAIDVGGEPALLLRRTVGTDGRSRAFINDQPVSIGLLKEIGESLVEIHGQFETQGLLNASTHRVMLDDYAGIGSELPARWREWREATVELERMREEAKRARTEEDYLRQAVEDLDGLSPQVGEEKTLSGLREGLMHREQILTALNAAHDALNAEDDPVRRAMAAMARAVPKMGGSGDAVMAALDRAALEMQEAGVQMQALSVSLEESEHSLETIDDRLHDLRAQARKHGCTVDELPSRRDELAARLNLIEHGEEALQEQARVEAKAKAAYRAQAEKDSELRVKAAQKLDGLVKKELGPLKLDKATFLTKVERMEEKDWGPGGIDRAGFFIATNPGATPAPLHKIASGGEMARFMLALKVVMAEIGAAQTLIFDEADSGIGGAVADAVGERLAKLARKRQVLVVTHAPQVAARADHHYIVRKSGKSDVKTDVVMLKDAQRREEIARMLAGATITPEARAAADRLLETGT